MLPLFSRTRALPKWLLAVMLTCLVSTGAAWAQPAPDAQPSLEPIKLQLKWTHQFQFAGYYQAIEQGYYRDAGMNVSLLEASPTHDPVKVVLSGEAQFGVGTANLLLDRARGEPVVVLGVVYQHSPLVLVARRDAGVGDIHDLVGKPIMIAPDEEDIYAYFKNEGVDPSKLNVIPHSFNLKDFTEGRVAAMTAYSTDEPPRLRALGIDFLEMTPRSGGVDFYGDNLFTTEQQIRDHPDRVRAFRAASFRGWAYALAHQEETVDLILRKYNSNLNRAQLLYEAKATERLVHPELIELGYMNPGRWQHIEDTFAEQGLLPKPIVLKHFLYDVNPKPDLRLLYGLLVGLAVISAAALLWLLPLIHFNRKLRAEIAQRIKVEQELIAAKERTEEALAAQSHFLAVLSHEVRSPIGGISRLLELILDERKDLPSEVRDDLKTLQQSAASLFQLVDELLEWSRCEADGVEINATPIPLTPFVNDLHHLFKPLADTKQLTFNYTIGSGVPDIILSDDLRLRQIVSNLLANAIKFTLAGSVRLTVSFQPAAKTGSAGRLFFAVEDTGIGISQEALGRLFKPYQQADKSIARKFGGSGLGLSISLHLAKLLGGTITARSEVDRGSTFTLEIATNGLADADAPSIPSGVPVRR